MGGKGWLCEPDLSLQNPCPRAEHGRGHLPALETGTGDSGDSVVSQPDQISKTRVHERLCLKNRMESF